MGIKACTLKFNIMSFTHRIFKVRKQYILVGNGILNGCKFVQILGYGGVQRSPACYSPQGYKQLDAYIIEQQHA